MIKLFKPVSALLALVGAVLAAGVLTATPPQLAAIHFHVQDSTVAPVSHALLHAESPNGPWNGVTDNAGDFTANLAPGHYSITISALGFNDRLLPADLADPGTITVGLDRVASSTSLWVRGKDFIDANGNRIVLNGIDAFVAYRQFLSGQDIAPQVAYSKLRGFNAWRVFFQGSAAQNTILQLSPTEPGYYEHIRPFVSYLNSQGLILLAEVYVDNQDIQSPVPAHWARMADLLRGTATILSGGNEYPKNGFDPGQLPNPGMLWSRGSALGDQAPFQPTASVMAFHPRRDLPAAKMDTVASPVFLYGAGGYPPIPLLIDEPPRMGSNGSGPEYAVARLCYEFARHYATEAAGAFFHNYWSMRGLPVDGITDACAIEWQKGMRLQ